MDSGLPPLRHLALVPDWESAQAEGEYRVSTRGLTLAETGFIHLSFPNQLAGVAERFYTDAGAVVVLEIDPASLTSPVRVEPGDPTNPDSERFPHLYGSLPVGAVTAVRPAWFDDDGRFRSAADAG